MRDDLLFEIVYLEENRRVVCDMCSTDWTDSEESGGFVFESRAVCPTCADHIEAQAKRYGETHLIRARCDERSFADWVREEFR